MYSQHIRQPHSQQLKDEEHLRVRGNGKLLIFHLIKIAITKEKFKSKL